MDVFVKIGFGIDLNGLGTNRYAPFIEALDELSLHIHERFNDLLWEMKQKFAIGKREQRVKKLTTVIDDFADEIIEAVKNTQNSHNNADASKSTGGDNIVSRYLASCRDQNLPNPTNRELRDLVIGFVFAGRDTTSVALTWTLYELLKNPSATSKIRQEVKEISKGLPLTYEMIQNMPFLHATIMESLRLHPSAPESFRFAVNDDVLPDGTIIPADSLIMYSINTINHCENVWDDPASFKPERFYGKKEPSPFAFATFNAGPRVCPGRNLALVEIKLSIAFLLSRFEFEDVYGHDGSYVWTTVMAMKGGFQVRAKAFS